MYTLFVKCIYAPTLNKIYLLYIPPKNGWRKMGSLRRFLERTSYSSALVGVIVPGTVYLFPT